MDEQRKVPAKCKEVFEYIKKCAIEMRTVTFPEVAQATNLANAGVGLPLGYIRDEICIKRKLPLINLIVVNTGGDIIPHVEFLPSGITITDDYLKYIYWRGMVLLVFAHDWSKENFE